MNEIGHNKGPDMAITAGEVANDLSGWMGEHPVISGDDEAREAKVYIDRAAFCIRDLEDERKSKTAPLNEQVETINNHYRAPRELLKGVIDELKRRFDSFLLLEERKRVVAAQDAARLAIEAEQHARDAENQERQAIDEADSGVVGLDIAAVTADADQAFADYQKAERQAQLAERETKVRIGGGFRRSLSLRNREVIIVTSYIAAIEDLGLTANIEAAIESGARAYKKLHGKYPRGITVQIERKT